jgi:predicted DNA-binding protein with PD1-like motif
LVRAERLGIHAASFQGIGAISEGTIAYFNVETKGYEEITVGQTELLSLLGNLTTYEGELRSHAHVVLSNPEGVTVGGHVVSLTVRPTLEVFLSSYTEEIPRTLDPDQSTLPLIDL